MYIVNLLANTDIPVNSGLRHDVRIKETRRGADAYAVRDAALPTPAPPAPALTTMPHPRPAVRIGAFRPSLHGAPLIVCGYPPSGGG